VKNWFQNFLSKSSLYRYTEGNGEAYVQVTSLLNGEYNGTGAGEGVVGAVHVDSPCPAAATRLVSTLAPIK
jgi:hypothetical protein